MRWLHFALMGWLMVMFASTIKGQQTCIITTPSDGPFCSNEEISLRVSEDCSGTSYEWSYLSEDDLPAVVIGSFAEGNINFPLNDLAGTTSFILAISANNTVQYRDTLQITVSESPELPDVEVRDANNEDEEVNTSALCSLDGIYLVADGAQWNTGAMDTLFLTASTGPGPFTYTVSNDSCVVTGEFPALTLQSGPPVTITYTDSGGINADDGLICAGENIDLTANAAGSNLSYRWSDGTTGASLTVTDLQVTTGYSVTVTGANICQSVGTASVTVNPLPTGSVVQNDDVDLCDGETIELIVEGTGTEYFLRGDLNPLSNGSTFSLLLDTIPAVYGFDSIRNEDTGCRSISPAGEFSFAGNELPLPFIEDFPPPCAAATVSISVLNGPFERYDWTTPTGSETQYDPVLEVGSFQEGVYAVTVTDDEGCTGMTSTDSIVYSEKPPVPAFSGDQTVCRAQQNVRFEVDNPQSGLTYNWSTDQGVAEPAMDSPVTYVDWLDASGMATLTLVAEATPNVAGDQCFATTSKAITVRAESAPALTEVFLLTEGANSFLITEDPPPVVDNDVCYEWGRDDGATLTDNTARIYYPGQLPVDQILAADYYVETWEAAAGQCAATAESACRNRSYYSGREATGSGPRPANRLQADLYPNPVISGQSPTLRVAATERLGTAVVQLFDINGRELLHRTLLLDAAGRYRGRLLDGSLSPGYYLVLITDSSTGTSRRLPLLINR